MHTPLRPMIALLATLAAGSCALAQEHGKEDHKHGESALPNCPVMGEPIDFTVRVVADDGPVYFCCDACIAKYEADPKKYAEKVAAQRVLLAKRPRIQVTCPLSGEPVDAKTAAEIAGQTVAFCCGKCKAAYEADPTKYKAKLEASFTYQTKCPVSGQPINAAAFVDLPTKQRIYFCCKGCPDKFNADAAKYIPKLTEQGVNVDAKKLGGAGKNP